MKSVGRRNAVKFLMLVGVVLSSIPFVPWGNFLTSSVSASKKAFRLQSVVIDKKTIFGAAAGQQVNVNDLSTFPPNGHWVITYPSSGDLDLDAQNPDTFQKYELIRLPPELGGDSKKATDFVAFSKVCVHLWCSPNYNPNPGHKQYECPCHGSIYELPDGKAMQGPAAFQPAPTNTIPMLTLQADKDGRLYIYYPNHDPTKDPDNNQVDPIAANGSLGYGRDSGSYENFIKPLGNVEADLAGLEEPIQ